MTRDRVIESIRGELSRVLNTRCSEPIDRLSGQERTVMNYGLPDFFTLSPTSDGDRQRLGQLIVDAIRAYEPRLLNPLVAVAVDPGQPRALRIVLEGTLVIDHMMEPVAFPLAIESRGGAIVVAPAVGVS
jgi:type VI secretion system lysozyme-like protein